MDNAFSRGLWGAAAIVSAPASVKAVMLVWQHDALLATFIAAVCIHFIADIIIRRVAGKVREAG